MVWISFVWSDAPCNLSSMDNSKASARHHPTHPRHGRSPLQPQHRVDSTEPPQPDQKIAGRSHRLRLPQFQISSSNIKKSFSRTRHGSHSLSAAGDPAVDRRRAGGHARWQRPMADRPHSVSHRHQQWVL